MKHLKTFENAGNNGYYWIISTNMPEFEISLQKIGVSPSNIVYFINNILILIPENEIYILKRNIYDDKYTYLNYCESNLYKIKKYGLQKKKVYVTDDDIKNYYIKKDTEKYNL